MADSILDTIKAMLGIPSTDTAFDTDIIVNINSALMVLNQLGIGTENVFTIEDTSAVWADFMTETELYPAAKTYIYLSVRLAFDPPATSFHIEAINRQLAELAWRLTVQVPIPPDPVVPEEP